jgi:hypothetical protein
MICVGIFIITFYQFTLYFWDTKCSFLHDLRKRSYIFDRLSERSGRTAKRKEIQSLVEMAIFKNWTDFIKSLWLKTPPIVRELFVHPVNDVLGFIVMHTFAGPDAVGNVSSISPTKDSRRWDFSRHQRRFCQMFCFGPLCRRMTVLLWQHPRLLSRHATLLISSMQARIHGRMSE